MFCRKTSIGNWEYSRKLIANCRERSMKDMDVRRFCHVSRSACVQIAHLHSRYPAVLSAPKTEPIMAQITMVGNCASKVFPIQLPSGLSSNAPRWQFLKMRTPI